MGEILRPFGEALQKSGSDAAHATDKVFSPFGIVGHLINEKQPLKKVGTDIANGIYEWARTLFMLPVRFGVAGVTSAMRFATAALMNTRVLPILGGSR